MSVDAHSRNDLNDAARDNNLDSDGRHRHLVQIQVQAAQPEFPLETRLTGLKARPWIGLKGLLALHSPNLARFRVLDWPAKDAQQSRGADECPLLQQAQGLGRWLFITP